MVRSSEEWAPKRDLTIDTFEVVENPNSYIRNVALHNQLFSETRFIETMLCDYAGCCPVPFGEGVYEPQLSSSATAPDSRD